jgi:hypothetical protein
MKLHIFKSGKVAHVYGFTSDASGSNLPVEFAPWTLSEEGSAEIGPNSSLAGIGGSGPIFAAIQRDGFYVARSEPVITRAGPGE